VSDNKCTKLSNTRYADKLDDFATKLSECNEMLFGILAKHDIHEFDPTG
jgi:hypothetical protein